MSIFNPAVRTRVTGKYQHRPSYYSRLTSKMGDIVPVLCKRINPGDWWQLSMNSITRLAPLANPVYDRLKIRYDAFYVQNRIIDADWEGFITGNIGLYDEEPTDGMLVPRLTIRKPVNTNFGSITSAFSTGSLFDYLNLQFEDYNPSGLNFGTPSELGSEFEITVNAEPILVYNKIYDDWYRNERFEKRRQKLMDTLYNSDTRTYTFSVTDSTSFANLNNFFAPAKANYAFDLYTTALNTPLVGGPVYIPGSKPGDDDGFPNVIGFNDGYILSDPIKSLQLGGHTDKLPNGYGAVTAQVQRTNPDTPAYVQLFANVKGAVAATLQELNMAYSIFRFFMSDTYNGNRYVEFMRSHYGVVVPDSTLRRAIFLGRISQYVNFSEIFQTSASTDESALGDYAGKGVGVCTGRLVNYQFEEHGYLMILMSIVADATYFQGFDPMWKVSDRFGKFFAEFQNIGDVPIDVRTLYMSASDIDLNESFVYSDETIANNTFGFNRANADYIWFKNEMHGNFLIDENMFSWTFARKFTNLPVLNNKFGKQQSINLPFTFTQPDSHNFYTDIYFDIKLLSQVEKYSSFTTH